MAQVVFDFTEAVEIDRTPVPPGVYLATIDATYAEEVKVAKNEKATPYVTLGFSIVEPEEYKGRMIFANYMLAGKGAGNSKQLLRNLGLYKDEDGNQFVFDTKMLHGYLVKIRVRLRTLPDGSQGNDVVHVAPADSEAA